MLTRLNISIFYQQPIPFSNSVLPLVFGSLLFIIIIQRQMSFQQIDIFKCLDLEIDYFNQLCKESNEYSIEHPYEPYNCLQNFNNIENSEILKPQNLLKTSIEDQLNEYHSKFLNSFRKLKSEQNQGPIIRKQNMIQLRRQMKSKQILSRANETQNMGKHLKYILKKYFYLLMELQYFDEYEEKAIIAFISTSGGLKAYQQLFSITTIRKKSYEFLSSKFYIEFVMSNNKLNYRSRLMMIKYAEKIRKISFFKTQKWIL